MIMNLERSNSQYKYGVAEGAWQSDRVQLQGAMRDEAHAQTPKATLRYASWKPVWTPARRHALLAGDGQHPGLRRSRCAARR